MTVEGEAAQEHAAYKTAKEAFVSELQGGTVLRINAVSLTALTTYTLWAVLRNRGLTFAKDDGRTTRRRLSKERWSDALVANAYGWSTEFVILCIPVLLACTVLHDHLVLLNGTLAGASIFILFAYPSPLRAEKSDVAERGKGHKRHWSKESDDEEEEDEERERKTEETSRTSSEPTFTATLRVSVDSAADAAHATAAPPTPFSPPGEENGARSLRDQKGRNSLEPSALNGQPSSLTAKLESPRKIVHRVSPSLARSAAPRLRKGINGSTSTPRSAYVPRNQPFLTVYRAHMMLMTVICILAVDFKAFPREFAKCESWGTSLMDLGVGSFVFSLGLVSALPMLRSPSQRFKPMRLQLLRDARKSLPLFLLGGIRVLMVKGVDYPEHVSEYGVHWNFFITLAVLPFFGTLCRPFARYTRFSTLGLVLSVLHEVLLNFTNLGGWAVSNTVARSTLISQNKEGLTSLPGYLAIFLLGLDLGHYVLPRDPYLAYRRPSESRKREKTDKLAMVLASYAILWWSAHYLQAFLTRRQVSRRLANLPYVLWVSAYNTLFLLAYVTIYMFLLQPLDERRLYGDANDRKTTRKTATDDDDDDDDDDEEADGYAKTPTLLHNLNAHAFAVFLVANLLTGLVNLSMQTMYASDTVAVIVLNLYLGACSALASITETYGWRLKL